MNTKDCTQVEITTTIYSAKDIEHKLNRAKEFIQKLIDEKSLTNENINDTIKLTIYLKPHTTN